MKKEEKKVNQHYTWYGYLITDYIEEDHWKSRYWWSMPHFRDTGEICVLWGPMFVDEEDGTIVRGPWKVEDNMTPEQLERWRETFDISSDFVEMLKLVGIEIKREGIIADMGYTREI